MPTSGFRVRVQDFDDLPESSKQLLDKGIAKYMSIVGKLIWIQGVRMDVVFAVLYLSWYLSTTRELPLVLGGSSVLKIWSNSDASLGTAPKLRSIGGHNISLAENSGSIYAKASAQTSTRLSSFEAELDEVSRAMKSINRVKLILTELGLDFDLVATLRNDNLSTMAFVRGEGVARGVRHMEMRLWYTREQHKKGGVRLEYIPSEELLADKLTKLGCVSEHRQFTAKILGLDLIDFKF